MPERKDGVTVAGLPMPDFRRIGVEPISGACGCEITGVDLREPLDEETLGEVMKAFEHFLVIVFRDQNLTPEQHKAFSRYFGEVDGQIFAIFVITDAAAEAAVGLGLLIALFRNKETVNADEIDLLKW